MIDIENKKSEFETKPISKLLIDLSNKIINESVGLIYFLLQVLAYVECKKDRIIHMTYGTFLFYYLATLTISVLVIGWAM